MDARRILVVDDDADVRALLTTLLELEGYEVRTASDGQQALAGLALEAPDCVLLDVMMPGLDGMSVLDAVRGSDVGLDLPVVMLTALADDQSQWRAWQGGADGFLSKPFDPGVLVRYLEALFAAAERTQEQEPLPA